MTESSRLQVEPLYPNIRLILINRLMACGDCVTAFAETARECGLKCPDNLSAVRLEVDQGACGSRTTAHLILKENAPLVAEDLYEALVAGVERYKQERRQKHCRGLDLQLNAIDCSGMAPVVMDLMLQLLEIGDDA